MLALKGKALALCFLMALLPLLSAASSSAAVTAIDDAQMQQQRADYLRAKKVLRAGKVSEFKKISRSLSSYPLHPYLDYEYLRRNLATAGHSSISDFIEENQHLAVSQRLRARWLKHLGKKKNWKPFLQYYDDTIANTALRCLYLRARIQTGEADEVWPSVPSIWVSGKSQPIQCDPLFEQWIAAGKLTDAHKWQRFKLAMKKGKTSLAKYLMGLMTDKDKKYAEKFLSYHRNPAKIKKRGYLKSSSNKDMDIALHAVRRLARKDLNVAAKRLDQLAESMDFAADDLAVVQKSLAYKMLNKPKRKHLDWIQGQLIDGVDADVAVYAARLALLFEHWPSLSNAIEKMPDAMQKTSRWRYWHAKAAMQENPKLDDIWKYNAFTELSGQRDFYGFLSAVLLEQEFDFNDHPSKISPEFKAKVLALPGLQIALELYAAGEIVSARREWRHTLLELPKAHMLAAAHIAEDWGWSHQAIMSAIMASAWDELELRFPLSYREYLQRGAKLAGIDLDWAYAIARQESAMNPAAISSAGARGLMQLMPATAKATVKRSSVPANAKNLLSEKHNALIGCAHLGELSRRYKGNRVLSSAAYNAGRSRVSSWLARTDRAQPLDVWIETIPFKETRHYVQNILMFSAIYSRRLGKGGEFIRSEEWIVTP